MPISSLYYPLMRGFDHGSHGAHKSGCLSSALRGAFYPIHPKGRILVFLTSCFLCPALEAPFLGPGKGDMPKPESIWLLLSVGVRFLGVITIKALLNWACIRPLILGNSHMQAPNVLFVHAYPPWKLAPPS